MSNFKEKILLCTFTTKNKLSEILKDIESNYNISDNKIIILYNVANPDELFCIYNCFDIGDVDHLDRTILLHRKKSTNTLYTINSLNKLIAHLTGSENKNYKIN